MLCENYRIMPKNIMRYLFFVALFNKKMKRRLIKATPKLIAVLGVAAVCFVAAVIITQQAKKAQIDAEIEKLETEYSLLLDEKQRLENMVDYVESEEYLVQYAREKLGFVREKDIKFDMENE